LNIIEAEKLVKKFNGFTAVDGISFSVKRGECFGFLGPNGAGKTTTIKMIQCVSPKSSGKLEVSGMEVDEQPRSIKEKLGVSPQEINLDPDFTVYENLVVFSRFFDISEKQAASRADDLIELFQLQSKRDTSINKLSGGMKRRLLLARSLINDPEILILDEPTIGLDPQARHLIWDKLADLKSRGITIILTTHYMDEAAKLCDRIAIMDSGRILTAGSPEALVRDNIRGSIIEANGGSEIVRCLEGIREKVDYEISGDDIRIFTDSPQEILGTILKQCDLSSTSVRSSTLEDVFLKLTGRRLRD